MVKKAFTLAELIIVLTIIGVITAMAITTFQRYDKGIRFLYSNTYHALDRALFNALNFSDLPNPFVTSELRELEGGGQEDVEVSPEEGARRLCEYFVRYMNTNSQNCSEENLALADGEHFGTVKFAAANGVNYYISARLPDRDINNYDDLVENEADKKRLKGLLNSHTFFIVYADINGDEPPNSMDYLPPNEQNNYRPLDPDIFAFAALDIGKICPLGVPEIDPRYMQTRISYYDLNATVNDEDKAADAAQARFSTVSLPYYISKAQAWGYYLDNNRNYSLEVLDEEPASYNDYIRLILPARTKIYSFLGEGDVRKVQIRLPEVQEGAEPIHLMSNPINGNPPGFGCVEMQPENCWVIVDKYLY